MNKIIEMLKRRSVASQTAGGNGFITTTTLSFDTGLNVRTLRRTLDAAMACGVIERLPGGPGKPYFYRYAGREA